MAGYLMQRRQMTTVSGDNIHNLAIRGNFDDCQALVKASFVAEPFLPKDAPSSQLTRSIGLGSWLRSFTTFTPRLRGGPTAPSIFSPHGRFGDIYAGYLAHRTGLQVNNLVIATNRNDVLHRMLITALTPDSQLRRPYRSMDISISSNFERLLFDLYEVTRANQPAYDRFFPR